jgi:hypothetical protein
VTKPMLGWKIDLEDRAALLARFPPRYADTDADHVTFGRLGEAPDMPTVSEATVIGQADDLLGVQALVVALNGSSDRWLNGSSDRWDGSTYHITWSLAPGRKAVESNDVIAKCGWEPIEHGPKVRLHADRWP